MEELSLEGAESAKQIGPTSAPLKNVRRPGKVAAV
jgi:hypothetical protein